MIPDRAVAHRQLPVRARPHAGERRGDYLRALTPAGAELEITGDSPPAAVVTDTPLVRALRDAGDLAFEPKQAWTNVADFTSRGIDAINFGPGATRYAHRRDELVEIASLESAYATLHRFLTDLTPCRSPPFSAARRPTRSCGSIRQQPTGGPPGSR